MSHEPRQHATMPKDDLQSLLPAEARGEIAAIPIRSLKLGLTATTLFCLGVGLFLGRRMAALPLIEWIALGCIACALILGALATRHDTTLLQRPSDPGDEASADPPA